MCFLSLSPAGIISIQDNCSSIGTVFFIIILLLLAWYFGMKFKMHQCVACFFLHTYQAEQHDIFPLSSVPLFFVAFLLYFVFVLKQ